MKTRSLTVLVVAALALGDTHAAVTANEPAMRSPASPLVARHQLHQGGRGVRRARRPIPNSYVVVLSPDQDPEAVGRETALVYAGRLRHIYRASLNGFAVTLSPAAAERLADDPRVVMVEEDGVISIAQAPPWGLDRIDQRHLPLNGIYIVQGTGAGVPVHVIDTGIRTTHVEFGGRAFIAGDYVDDDNDQDESDVGDDDGNPGVPDGADCHGHGTHVAATIGGLGSGVAKGVTLYAHRVLNCVGDGTIASVVAGIDAVTAHPDRPAVANMSLGGGVSDAMDEAVRNSIVSGVTYVIAAGNDDTDALNRSPSRVVEAITVGATDANDERAAFSNYGTVLDLFAPGASVQSAWHTSDTATNTISGTSMASPHVAGVAALHLETNPDATPQQVRDVLVSSATPGDLSSIGTGSPNLLLYAGILETPPVVSIVAPSGGEKIYAGTPFTIEWMASDADGIDAFDVLVSSNAGASYSPVPGCTGLAGTVRSCVWSGAAPLTIKGRIKVVARDSLGAEGAAASGANFSILSGLASVSVTAPNTAVSWAVGTTRKITWSHNLGANVYMRIELSRDGGTTYPEVITPSVKNTAQSSGSYLWQVTGPLTATAIVRVSWTSGAMSDVSNVPFAIATPAIAVKSPAKTNVNWGYGSTQRVKWTNNLGVGARVDLHLSTDGGLTYPIALATGVLASASQTDVTTPTLASPTTAARLRISWSNPPPGASAEGISPNYKITPAFVAVSKPNGGETWTVGTVAKIVWTSNLGPQERVRLELSSNGGASFDTVIAASTPADGTHSVTVQGAWVSPTAKVRVTWLAGGGATDVSNAVFVIQ